MKIRRLTVGTTTYWGAYPTHGTGVTAPTRKKAITLLKKWEIRLTQPMPHYHSFPARSNLCACGFSLKV